MRVAAVACVIEDRWIACAVRDEIGFGLRPGSELSLASTICDETRKRRQAVFLSNVGEDKAYHTHPDSARYDFKSYIAVPIILRDGSFFGTLCAVDPQPSSLLNADTVRLFQLLAGLLVDHVKPRDQQFFPTIDAGRGDTAELKAHLLTALGQDLVDPLCAVGAGVGMLRRLPLEDRAADMVRVIEGNMLRVAGLIEDLMDFTRGQLGGGLAVDRTTDGLLEINLRLVIKELGAVWPDRVIWAHHAITEQVNCDCGRVAQLLSNLLTNALTYGHPTVPVRVRTGTSEGVFELSVSNAGDPMSPEVMERLFHPFQRDILPGQRGLGLGLYIASEIARAHGGTLVATSTVEETRFRFQMPCR
jgi:signal transduction histidine kinase